MAIDNIRLDFTNEFKGTLTTPKGQVLIGRQDGGIRPYHLLLGALGSCFYATFLEVVEKKQITFDSAQVELSGTQKEDIPTTLNYVKIKLIVKNPSNEKQIIKSAELGAKYCSIYETISRVAKIELEVEFDK